MYDIVGDIHGHAIQLKKLLHRLGYEQEGYVYRHPTRKVVFVGDYIDRGPNIADSIRIVKSTIEAGAGYAIMGNHEYNAIAYHTLRIDGEYFRPHTEKNRKQHAATLEQLSQSEMKEATEWFRSLPVTLELEGIRVVHAAWQHSLISVINQQRMTRGDFTHEFLTQSEIRGSGLNLAIEAVLKGPEITLPDGQSFHDKDGHSRRNARAKWWQPRIGKTLSDYLMLETDIEIPTSIADHIDSYPDDAVPVFFGHYWLQTKPEPLAANVACVDYSVAKGGKLCAYRWNGEHTLQPENFASVDAA